MSLAPSIRSMVVASRPSASACARRTSSLWRNVATPSNGANHCQMSAYRAASFSPRFSPSAPMTTGIRAWTGCGAWRTFSNWYFSEWWVTSSPASSATTIASNSSNQSMRWPMVLPGSMPWAMFSKATFPAPRPRIDRPWLAWSMVTAILATTPGLRNVLAPTSSPSRARVVACAHADERRPALEEALVRVAAGRVEVIVAPDVGVAHLVQRPDDVQRLVPGRAVGQDLGADLERHRAGSSSPASSLQSLREPDDGPVECTDPDVAGRRAVEEVAGQRDRAEDVAARRVDLHQPAAEAVPAEQLADRAVADDPQLVLVELDALGRAEVGPRVDVAAVGLEPLDPQVAAVADPDRPVRGDRHGMRRVELAGRGARDAPRPAVGAVGVEHRRPGSCRSRRRRRSCRRPRPRRRSAC